MNTVILGAGGFIGTNLAKALKGHPLTLVDRKREYFKAIEGLGLPDASYIEAVLNEDTDFDGMLEGQDTVYHLISTTVPTTSNQHIVEELKANVILSAKLFEACVRQHVGKVVFISSGGTVYGKEAGCPLGEEAPTDPISSYGVQKLTIEKLLYLYSYIYGLDYRIIRLSNPYGPYQRPNGIQGAVTTFTYKALKGEDIEVYGDGSVVRDYIYIEDAVRGILNIVNKDCAYRTYNLGSGYGTSISQVLGAVQRVLGLKLRVRYTGARKVDVPVNFLDMKRYEDEFGLLHARSIEEGIRETAAFMREHYSI